MDKIEIKGIVYSIDDKQQISQKFAKREIIIETLEQYPQHLKIHFINDKCDILNMYKIGDSVAICINLRGRLFVDKSNQRQCFNALEGWKIELNGINQQTQ